MRIHHFYVFLSILLIENVSCISKSEFTALKELYYNTSGDTWSWRSVILFGPKWSFGTSIVDPCADNKRVWQGLKCDLPPSQCAANISLCSITEINLQSYGLIGSLPSTINSFHKLQYLDVHSNEISGPIPKTLGNIHTLKYLYLYNNLISGVIPSNLGDISNLEYLELYINHLTGPIPPSLGYLSKLVYLILYNNELSGPIPRSIGNLTNLAYLDLDINHLTGNIPSNLGNLIQLNALILYTNLLNGSIPSSFGNLTNLKVLELHYNRLTGQIPTNLGQLIKLQVLFLYANYLTGFIPISFGNLTNLNSLDLYYNHLSGPIPSTFEKLNKLEILYLYSNILSGYVPTQLGNLLSLKYFYLFGNHLSGPIPNSFGNLTNLEVFYVQDNFISNCLPVSLGELKNVLHFNVSSNLLECYPLFLLSNLSYLQTACLSNNLFVGTFPMSLQINDILQLDLSDNQFSGKLPRSIIKKMPKLQSLILRENHFIGDLDIVFHEAVNSSLNLFDGSKNHFSGYLPTNLFALPFIETIILIGNCFQGSIPDNICQSLFINEIALDGLSSNCQKTNWNTFINNKAIVHGSIPSCVWKSQSLQTLHLSANGLNGQLGEIISNSLLKDISLSHNRISGTIPNSLKSLNFTYLDLSNNKLEGTCDHFMDFHNNDNNNHSIRKTLKLSLNRLSGNIPTSFYTFDDVNILEGNVFSCSSDKLSQDAHIDSYCCGSKSLNYSMYLMAFSVMSLFTGALIICRVYYSRYKIFYNIYLSNIKSNIESVEMKQFDSMISKIFQTIFLSSIIISFICIPAYLYFKLDTNVSTHTYQYLWLISCLYMSQLKSSLVIYFIWLFVISFLCYKLTKNEQWRYDFIDQQRISIQFTQYFNLKIIFVLIINVLIYSAIYGIYLYVIFDDYSTTIVTVIQLFVSLFKIFWNNSLSIYLSKLYNQKNIFGSARVISIVMLFNNVLLLLIVTILSDPSCFLYAIRPSGPITTSYVTNECFVSKLYPSYECVVYGLLINNIQIHPLFIYNNQCSSAILYKFIPIFIYTYSMKIVFSIALQFYLLLNPFNNIVYKKCLLLFRFILPRIVWDLPQERISDDDHIDVCLLTPIVKAVSFDNAPLFSDNVLVSSMVLDLTILCTLGIASPYLAILIGISSCCFLIQWRLIISRYLYYMIESNNMKEALNQFKKSTSSTITEVSFMHHWSLVAIVSLILCYLLCVDMIADDNPWPDYYLFILISFFVLPLGIMKWVSKRIIFHHIEQNENKYNLLTESDRSYFNNSTEYMHGAM